MPFLCAYCMHFVGLHLSILVYIFCIQKMHGNPDSEFVLCIYPSKVHTHSSEHTHTHTHREHTPGAVWSPGSSWGFGALLKGTSVVYGGESAVHSYNSCRPETRSQPLDYESDSLTIRPRLPLVKNLPKYKAPTPHPWILTYQLHMHTKVHFCVQIVCQIETENRAIETQIHEIGLE